MSEMRIYFIQSGNGHIKIGISSDIRKRIKSLQTASSMPLRLLAHMPGAEPEEKYLHETLSAHHVGGEWFAPHADVLDWVETALTHNQSFEPAASKKPRDDRGKMNPIFLAALGEELRLEYQWRPRWKAQAARDFGVTERAICGWLSGKSAPSMDSLVAICRKSDRLMGWFMRTVIAGVLADMTHAPDEWAFEYLKDKPYPTKAAFLAGSHDKAHDILIGALMPVLWEGWAIENQPAFAERRHLA